MKEKKKKTEDSVCRVCPKKVGADPTGFVRFADGSVSCLRHAGVLAFALGQNEEDASRTLIFARNIGHERDGRYRTLDPTVTGPDLITRTVDSIRKLTAAATGGQAANAGASPVSRTVSRDEPTSQNDTRKEGEGGRGMGEFGRRRRKSEGVENRRPSDPKENLFRLDRPERTDNSTHRRKKRKGRRKTA